MAKKKVRDARTGQVHSIEWDKPRPPTRDELDEIIKRDSGVIAPMSQPSPDVPAPYRATAPTASAPTPSAPVQSMPKVDPPSAPMPAPNSGKSWWQRAAERDTGSIGSRLSKSWDVATTPSSYFGGNPDLPQVPGVNKPLLPEVEMGGVSGYIYNEIVRPSTSVLGAETDAVIGGAVGRVAKPIIRGLGATRAGKAAVGAAESIFSKVRGKPGQAIAGEIAEDVGKALPTVEPPITPALAPNVPAPDAPFSPGASVTPSFGSKGKSSLGKKATSAAVPEKVPNLVEQTASWTDQELNDMLESLNDQELPSKIRKKFEKILTDRKMSAGQAVPSTAAEVAPKLPKDLSGAKPRFNIGTNAYHPDFESDVDKALYIIAQKVPSKRNADYLKFAMEHTGLNEADAVKEGRALRLKLKGQIAGQEPGSVKIGQIFKKPAPVQSALPTVEPPISPRMSGPTVDAPTPIKPGTADPLGGGPPKPPRAPDPTVSDAPDAPRYINPVYKAFNTVKALKSSVDFSAPRQAAALISRKEFWQNTPKLMKSLVTKNFENFNEHIKADPMFERMQKAGLGYSDVVGKKEEEFAANYLGSIPIVKNTLNPIVEASNRSFSGFLNSVRHDYAKNLLTKMDNLGVQNVDEQVMKFVNSATGRGNLGTLEKSAEFLNAAFYSPKFIKARLDLLNPKFYYDMHPKLRYEALKTVASSAAIMGTSLKAIELSGMADVEWDPRSTDFAKIRVGNLRLDALGGFQQYIRSAVQLGGGAINAGIEAATGTAPMKGSVKSTQTDEIKRLDYEKGDYGKIAGKMIRSKLSPAASFLYTMATGKDFANQPPEAVKEFRNTILPMMIDDLWSIAEDDPKLLWAIAPSAFGIGIQNYDEPKTSPSQSGQRPRTNKSRASSRPRRNRR